MATHTVKFNKEVTFDDSTPTTAAAGVSFVINPTGGGELMPDPNFSGACGDANWVCSGGGGTTTIIGGVASIGTVGSVTNPAAVSHNYDPAKSYQVTIDVQKTSVSDASITLGGDGANGRIVALNSGVNILSDFTGLEVGSGGVSISLISFSAGDTLELTEFSVIESPSVVSLNVTSDTVSPSDVIEYDVTWADDPVAGDVVEFRYDDTTGNYEDADGEAMDSQELRLINCLTVPITGNLFIPLGSDSLITSDSLTFTVQN